MTIRTTLAAASLLAIMPASLTAQEAAPLETASTIGLIGTGLQVTDLERSIRFYVDGLGLVPLRTVEREDTIDQFLGYPAMPFPPVFELIAARGVEVEDADAPAKGVGLKFVLSTQDARAAHARLEAAGYSPEPLRLNEATGIGVFFVTDPDGYRLELVQRPQSPPA